MHLKAETHFPNLYFFSALLEFSNKDWTTLERKQLLLAAEATSLFLRPT